MIKELAKKIINILDNHLKADLHRKAVKLEGAYYDSGFLNRLRRNINPALVKWRYKLGIRDKNPLRLQLGCGSRHFEGYINIDWRKTRATDLVCDIRKLPYIDNSVELIETYHVIEHLPRHDLPKTLKEWHRILVEGGKLIIECPDFDEIVKRYLEGDERQLDGIFGLQRFEGDYHLFGYNTARLTRVLKECGFTNLEKKDAQDDHAKEWSCIRVECIKDEKDISSSSRIANNYNLRFTGERVIEGDTPQRIWLDHVARYQCASRYVKGKAVLDIACGTGYGSKILYEGGGSTVLGIDISNKAIDFALSTYKDERLDFTVGDILNIRFPDNYFDAIVCFETIEHVKDQERALSELLRVLKPDGLLIISSPNRRLTSPGKSLREPPDNLYHMIEYSTKEFISALRDNVEILEVYGQRPKNKLFFSPILEKVLRLLLPGLYNPEAGGAKLERVSLLKEYRYITAVCRKLGAKWDH
ncbi:MAG: methyltransferase domain-containing protein [Proteobacteria bacterium]|nr:methyltransferase domain-containing protein [Pseudomonadota bacterium]